MTPLKVAILGTGIFAKSAHLPSFQELGDLYTVYGCFNRTRAKAEEFAELAGGAKIYNSIEDAFKDPEIDVVDALLPVENNLHVVELAVKYGKPLCFEKPIAANIQDAEKIVELANSEGAPPILVLEQWCYFKVIDMMKSLLPKIGNVVSFAYSSTGQFNYNNKYLATEWRLKPKHVGGFLSDGGVHQLALLTGVLGPVTSVSARTTQIRELSGTDDVAYTLLTAENGAIGTFTYGSAFGNTPKTCYFQILGDDGSIYYDFSPGKPASLTLRTGGRDAQTANAQEDISLEKEYSGTTHELEVFGKALQSGDKSALLSTPEVTFHHLAIVDAIVESSKQGAQPVSVKRLG